MDKGNPLKILIVDDDEEDYMIIRELFSEIKEQNYSLDWVSDYDSALETIGRNSHNVYLFDYRLGGRSGLDLLRKAINNGCKAPIILLTGQGDHDIDLQAMKMGAADYLVKGEMNALFLDRSIRYALEHKKMENKLRMMLQDLQKSHEEFKKAEEVILKSEAKYRTLFDLSRDAIMTLAPPSWKFTSANLSTVKLFGYDSEKEFTFKGPWDVSPERQSDGELSSQKAKRMIERAMNEGSNFFEWDHTRLNGEVFPATVLLSKIELDGKQQLQATVRDITQSKRTQEDLEQSEKRFMDVLHSSEDAILLIDDETFMDTNEATARMLKYPNREEFLMTHPSELSPPHQPDGQNSFDKANEMMKIATERGFHRFEWMHRKKTGEDFPVEVSLTPITYKGKTIIHCLWRDLTEEKKAAEEKQQLQLQLQQAQKLESIGTMANGIAHNFNTILGSIRGLVEMGLMEAPPNSRINSDLKKAVKTIEDAKELTGKILIFSRDQKQALEPVKIQTVVQEAMDLFKASMTTPVEIRRNINMECEPVLAAPNEISQVVMNLCTNAYHALEGINGRITISLDEVEIDEGMARRYPNLYMGKYAHLVIRDTGKGMNSVTKERIFEPFFTTKEVGKGTGLGLSVIHGIVMNHHGEITVDSQLGKGTTVNVYFPLADNDVNNTKGA